MYYNVVYFDNCVLMAFYRLLCFLYVFTENSKILICVISKLCQISHVAFHCDFLCVINVKMPLNNNVKHYVGDDLL